jgi:hypothetical protein
VDADKEGWSAPKIVENIKNWFEAVSRFLGSFHIGSTSTLIVSIKTAILKLISFQNHPDLDSGIDTALQFAFCSMALLTFHSDQEASENFGSFVNLFQLLTQLSSIDAKYASPSFALLRLIQQLHVLQRHDLISNTVSHVMGIPIDATWLVRGLTTSASVLVPSSPVSGPTPPSNASPFDQMPRTTPSGLEAETSSHQVRMVDAWLWATSPALLIHLTLSAIQSWPLVPYTPALPVSLITVFEEEDFFPNLSPLLQKVFHHPSGHDSVVSMLNLNAASHSEREAKPNWTARGDVWICWLLLRLSLHINRNADLQRLPNAPLGGNYDGIANCLWTLCENVGRVTCSRLPLMTLPIHSVVFETLQTFVDLALEGEQKCWSLERIKLLFLPSHAPNFAQCLVITSLNPSGLVPSMKQVICPINPENVLQALIFVALSFLRSNLTRTSHITPSTTPMVPSERLNTDESNGANVNSMDIDLEPEKSSLLKKSDFLTYMARHYRITSSMIFLANVPSVEKRRNHIGLVNTVRNTECVGSPSMLLQLCKALYIETIIPADRHASKYLFDNMGETPRKCVSTFELIRKRALSSFAHLRHFADVLGTHPQKCIFPTHHLHPVPLNFDFLGGDYRSLVNHHPFLATIDFPSLHSTQALDWFIFNSLQKVLSPSSTPWEAQCIESVVSWSFRFVSLERTLQAFALGILHPMNQAMIQQDKVSATIDSLHLTLIENPSALFGFNLRFLAHPTLFNHLFYKLVSFYFCLSKAEIVSVMRETQTQNQSSSNLDDSEHSDDDSPRSKEPDNDGEANGSLDRSTTRSSTTSGGVSPLDESESSKSEGSPIVAALIDPFSLRRIPKNRRRTGGGGNLRGEKKLTSEDADSLKRLQDCVMVHCLIDLLLLVEDNQIENCDPLEQGAKEEIRIGICLFLQSLFINDAPLMSLIHQQGYPARALPWLTNGVPAMHYCLELAPQLLARVFQKFTATDADLQSVTFPIKMAAHTIQRYPTQRSLDLATYILGLYKSCGKSLNSTIWASTLSDLAIIVLTFPTLTSSLMDLIILLDGSSSSSKSITFLPDNSSRPQTDMQARQDSMVSGSYDQGGSTSREVLRKVFNELVQGNSVAPFLRG